MEAKTEWKMGGVWGGAHSSPTALELGISAPSNHPKFPEFCLGLGGGTKEFILHDQTTGDLKSNHLQAQATLTALSVLPPFLSTELWVILSSR